MAGRCVRFSKCYRSYFRSGNHDVSRQASVYFSGLMRSQKRNMEPMAGVVPETDTQALQNFLTHSS